MNTISAVGWTTVTGLLLLSLIEFGYCVKMIISVTILDRQDDFKGSQQYIIVHASLSSMLATLAIAIKVIFL